jgi:prepilin-type N-terminal cleavage/methylation domain-containing protein
MTRRGRFGRRGWTMIELLMVLLIMGILVNLAVPALRVIRRRAEAAHVIADVRAIHIGAQSHHAETGSFPDTENFGVVPAAMVPALPEGFEFRYGDVRYRWHRYALPDGLPAFPGQTVLLAVEVQAASAEMASMIRSLYKGRLTFGSATNLFFVLE